MKYIRDGTHEESVFFVLLHFIYPGLALDHSSFHGRPSVDLLDLARRHPRQCYPKSNAAGLRHVGVDAETKLNLCVGHPVGPLMGGPYVTCRF